MINLFLDSSALRASDPRSFFDLMELIEQKSIRLHVPSIVVKEVSTGLAELDQHALAKIVKAAAGASRWTNDDSVTNAAAAIKEFFDTAAERIETGLNKWLLEVGAVQDGFAAMDCTAVFGRYFRGEPPFRGRKSREDLPDGFIFDSLQRLSRIVTVEEIHFVAGDKALRTACEGIPKVYCYPSIREFVRSGTFDALRLALRERTDDDAWVTRAMSLVEAKEAYVDEQASEAITDTLQHEQIASYSFPSDEGLAVVIGVGHANVSFDWGSAKRTLHDQLSVPIEARVEVGVRFTAHKADFWSQHESSRIKFSVIEDDLNRHYLEAEAEVTVNVKATALVSFDEVLGRLDGIAEVTLETVDGVEVDDH